MRSHKIERWIQHAVDCQYDVWQQLIASGEYTAFGKQHHFSKIETIEQFQQQVPIRTYEQIQPSIQQMLDGEENVLWNTPVEWFAKSSGTTDAKSKFIPISYESLEENHFLASKDVLSLYYEQNPESDLLTGKGLVVGGSYQSYMNNKVQLGDVSAVIMQNGPFWSHWLRTPALEIALMNDWETKLEAMADSTILDDVTSLAGVPTWMLVLLKRVLEKTGKKYIIDVWPNLELYLHGGVNFAPYREQFEALIGAPIHYVEIYNASEGLFAVQHNADQDGMLLFVEHGVFYEFVPLHELHLPKPKALTLAEVTLHENYAMVISTYGGLWRYLIGDTVKFTSLSPYKIKITGRTKHFINAFGEELMVDNADEAIQMACKATDATIIDYTAAPIFFTENNNGAHEWLIEFEKAPPNMAAFVQILDATLQQVNSDYEAKRYKNLALQMPTVHVLPKGGFEKWLKEKGKLGGQHKVPRLRNDRSILEQIKAINNLH
jgi:hypothetical protein